MLNKINHKAMQRCAMKMKKMKKKMTGRYFFKPKRSILNSDYG